MLVLCLIRIGGIIFGSRDEQEKVLIKHAEKLGINLIVEALKLPVIGVIICIAWLISTRM